MTVLVTGFPAGAFAANCYLAAPAPGEECVIVDPGQDAERGIEELLDRFKLKPIAVLLTHGHIDHVASVVPVCGAHDVPAWIHPADRYMMSDPEKSLGRSIGTNDGTGSSVVGIRTAIERSVRIPALRGGMFLLRVHRTVEITSTGAQILSTDLGWYASVRVGTWSAVDHIGCPPNRSRRSTTASTRSTSQQG